MRFWLGLTSLAIVTAATPSVARAELNGGKIKVEIKIPADPDGNPGSTIPGDFVDGNADQDLRYFNLSRCVCDDLVEDQNYLARIYWETPPMPASTAQLFLLTGTGCETAMTQAERDARCTELDPIASASELTPLVDRIESVRALLTPARTSTGCDPNVTSSGFGVYSNPSGTQLILEKVEPIMPVDMKAPEMPDVVSVSAEEGQISISWEQIASGIEDFEYFQALCAIEGGEAAHDDPTDEPAFDTTAHMCRLPVTEFEGATIDNDVDVVGNPVTYATLPVGLAQLQDAFICGQSNGSGDSITLGGLSNGVPYVVVLVAMDKAGNFTARYVPKTVTPQPVTDFWEDLNEENGEIEGGLCLVEATYGAGGGGLNGALRAWRDELRQTAAGRWFVERYYAWGAPLAAAARESVVARVAIAIVMLPLIAIALVWNAIGLPAMLAIALALIWLRRRRKQLAIAAALVLTPGLAAAQSVTPYWDDDLAAEESETPSTKWHFGLRIGPYTPEIDDERFGDPGPYERMFGDGSWMPVADLHRVWGTRFGQIGGGFSVGYFGKTADAYLPGTMERAEGNENSLKIIPMELTAIWRASQLHDNWSIPLVPYVRGGLGYSLWWVRRPDGEFAKACPENMTNCDRAIGGSLGLVGAAGLSIRAEGIDPSAARSMRDSGLDHAGFYAELEMAWIDGFGNAKKLSLGDTTWFAGIDFEF